MNQDIKFQKKRKFGLWILWINLILAILVYYFTFQNKIWFYIMAIYILFSVAFLVNRYKKKQPTKTENYIFGEKLGEKMQTTGQKFIFEAMMMSLVFIILGDIAGTIYTLFFTNLALVVKIIAGISGFFGGLFMLMILISTFQSYKTMQTINEVKDLMSEAVSDVNEELKGGLKNG